MIAAREQDNVVEHQLVLAEFDDLAVAQDAQLAFGEDRELVHALFRADLLHDTDDGIEQHHADEQQVLVRADEHQQDKQEDVDAVEYGADVVDEDALDRLGFDGRGGVDLTLGFSLFRFGRGQPAQFFFFHGILLKKLIFFLSKYTITRKSSSSNRCKSSTIINKRTQRLEERRFIKDSGRGKGADLCAYCLK